MGRRVIGYLLKKTGRWFESNYSTTLNIAQWKSSKHQFSQHDYQITFQGSSVAERSAVNRNVVGSNPTPGAKLFARGIASKRNDHRISELTPRRIIVYWAED